MEVKILEGGNIFTATGYDRPPCLPAPERTER